MPFSVMLGGISIFNKVENKFGGYTIVYLSLSS